MSDSDKMMTFGTWLTTRFHQHKAELLALSVNARAPEAQFRVKAGCVEAFGVVLQAFTDLYKNDLGKFQEAYMDIPRTDKESTDDQNTE